MPEVSQKRVALEFFIEIIMSIVCIAGIMIIVYFYEKLGVIGLFGLMVLCIMEMVDFIFTYKTVMKDPEFLSSFFTV